MATPLRDELGLNEGGMSLAVSSQRALREQQVRGACMMAAAAAIWEG
jgi:hypothetical protein